MAKLSDITKTTEVLEPYDPEYVVKDSYAIPELSNSEKRFLRKLSILTNKMRREKVRGEWMPRWQCYRLAKYINSDYPTYRYLRVNIEENDYSFGTEDEDLVYDGKVSVVVAAAKKWLNSGLLKK